MVQNADAAIDALLQQAGEQFLKQGGRVRRSDDRVIFDTAVSFHQAAKRCAVSEANGDGGYMSPTSPLICCLAFACELYVKALLASSSIPTRGHDLSKLFERLSATDKKGIREQYKVLTGREAAAFRRDVSEFANAFVEWRYIFEQASARISIQRLAQLTQSLFRHIRQTKPDSKVVPRLEQLICEPMPEEILRTVALGGGVIIRAIAR